MTSTIICEDSVTCITQLKKWWFTHDLQRDGDINIVKEDFWAINSQDFINLKMIVCIRGKIDTFYTLFPLAIVLSH